MIQFAFTIALQNTQTNCLCPVSVTVHSLQPCHLLGNGTNPTHSRQMRGQTPAPGRSQATLGMTQKPFGIQSNKEEQSFLQTSYNPTHSLTRELSSAASSTGMCRILPGAGKWVLLERTWSKLQWRTSNSGDGRREASGTFHQANMWEWCGPNPLPKTSSATKSVKCFEVQTSV